MGRSPARSFCRTKTSQLCNRWTTTIHTIGFAGCCARLLCSHATLPNFELDGLSGQIRRAAVSIPSNVAEGACRRGSTRAYLNHVSIALGSQGELETCVEIAGSQTYLSAGDRDKLLALVASTGRLLNGLYNSLDRRLLDEKGRTVR